MKKGFGPLKSQPAISALIVRKMTLEMPWEKGFDLWNLTLQFPSSFIKLKIRLLDYFYIMSFWRHKLFFFNDSISSYKMSFISLETVISDIEFNDHLLSTISVFITSKARQNFISWLFSTTNMFVNSKARQKSNDALLLLQGCLSN